jgi:transglutaminase-like putative cysteine protease
MRNLISAVLAIALSAIAGRAGSQPATDEEIQVRMERNHVVYKINSNGSHEEIREVVTRILDKRAVEFSKFAYAGWSTSVEKGEVLEAYTLKADGTKIVVPKNNYQLDISKGRDADSPVYSDRTSLSVLFPDVSAGDATFFKYRISSTEAIFPGYFSSFESYSPFRADNDVRVSYDAPTSLTLRFHSKGMQRTESVTADGRRVTSFTYSNPKPSKAMRSGGGVWEIDEQIGVSASTFADYGQIARAYWERAKAKSVPTPRVTALAAKIVGDRKDTKAQIEALHAWVTSNIHYAGNCVGVGAVVPRDLDFVLDNRIGDCKDYATLMQALMAARGIKSEQALVNAGGSWRLPTVPLALAVNHVINYVPSLDLYFDATATQMPIGMLSVNVAGKPVLLTENYVAGKKTPWVAAMRGQESSKARLKIAADGSVTGDVEVVQSGSTAISTRQRMKNATAAFEKRMLEDMFNREKNGGWGKLEKDDPNVVADTYRYRLQFHVKEFLTIPGPSAWSMNSPGFGDGHIGGRVYGLALEPDDISEEVLCLGGKSTNELTVEFPKNAPLLIKQHSFCNFVGTELG